MSIRTEKGNSHKEDNRRQLGLFGEQFAVAYLTNVLGWCIQAQNWRCRFGEIDIVGFQRNSIILVEVRTKHTGGYFGTAVDSVDERKLRQMRRIGRIYTGGLEPKLQKMPIRFDLIALQIANDMIVDMHHFRDIIC